MNPFHHFHTSTFLSRLRYLPNANMQQRFLDNEDEGDHDFKTEMSIEGLHLRPQQHETGAYGC